MKIICSFLLLALSNALHDAGSTLNLRRHQGLDNKAGLTRKAAKTAGQIARELNEDVTDCVCVSYPCDCGRHLDETVPTSSPSMSPTQDPGDYIPACPMVDEQAMSCGGEYEPLVCGSNDCPYDNACIASYAGWNLDNCRPVILCLTGESEGVTCPPSKVGYSCGDVGCWYDGACEAELAGWDLANCTPMASCPRNYDASQCQPTENVLRCGDLGCKYRSECEAEAASWNVAECE
jgi:hypothetical protein